MNGMEWNEMGQAASLLSKIDEDIIFIYRLPLWYMFRLAGLTSDTQPVDSSYRRRHTNFSC
jgi:hypothetical protein